MARRDNAYFVWLDRAFWLIWLAFPFYLAVAVSEVLRPAGRLAAPAPDQAACVERLPRVGGFSARGQLAFWSAFAVQFLLYAALLGMAHRVIRSCARGDLFVASLVRTMGRIGLVVTLLPLVDLLLANGLAAALVATGDARAFLPHYALDATVLGVGLLLATVAAALRQAMRLSQDAELTI